MLIDQVRQYQVEGRVVVCGDFNAQRLKNVDNNMNIVMGDRKSVDPVKNGQGWLLIECMLRSGLCFVNGAQG